MDWGRKHTEERKGPRKDLDEPQHSTAEWRCVHKAARAVGLESEMGTRGVVQKPKGERYMGSNAAWRVLNAFLEVKSEAEDAHWI